MKRIVIAAVAASTAAVTFAPDAFAQDRSGVLDSRHRRYESPQNFAFELRFSPFRPDVDSDPNLKYPGTNNHATPFQDTFGTTPRLLISAELDWQAVRIPYLGTLGPGLSVGYTSMSAAAHLKNDPTQAAGEDTSLSIFPFYAVAVLRADVLMREARIPLVPYVKAGVAFAFWRASNDSGTSVAPRENGVAGKGHTWGTMAALGLSLDLNTFDRYTARNFDNEVGVNHTYLFAEYYMLDMTGLGIQKAPLRVGDHAFAFGLAFEF